MISSMASMTISSSSSAAVRVEKATSEFLIGPDWTLNIDICDTVNSNQMLAKDVVKAVKKRLQHKNPKVQLLALTLLETMVKNCGDYVHFQIADKNILQEMVKIVRKKTDMHVRDKVLTLIGSWYEAFGGSRGRYPQYYMAYEELRRSGVQFPQRPPDAAPIFTPPVTHQTSRQPQPGYGMPSSSSTRLDEAMAADDHLSLSSINAMRNVLDLLNDMLQAIDPNDRSAIKNEVIIDLVEQCRTNQRKLVQFLETTGDEELLAQGLELNDKLQIVLVKHDAIASGSPLPPEVANITNRASEKRDSGHKSAEVSIANATANETPPAPEFPAHRGVTNEEDDEEDDFAQLARRHSKQVDVSHDNTSMVKSEVMPSEAPSNPAMSNALVPVDASASVGTMDQNIIDLLSITLSTGTSTEQQTSQTFTSTMHTPVHNSPTSPGTTTFSYPASNGLAFNNYIAPWAQPQPQRPLPENPPDTHFQQQPYSQPQPLYNSQPQNTSPVQLQSRPQVQPQSGQQPYHQPQLQYAAQAIHQPQYTSSYPPPPWAATPGYFTNQNTVSVQTYAHSNPRPPYGEAQINSATHVGQKPFVPSYRLFEDLDVFGNTDGRFKSTNNSSPMLSGSTNQSMVGGRK